MFNRRQALENAAFLEALRQTGNPRLAARLLGVHRSTYTKRRAKCAAFALAWDAALAAAHAAFHEAGGVRAPGTVAQGTVARNCPHSLRTKGGELCVGRTRGGRLQLRRAPAGRMTRKGEQAFLRALCATANVRLSAAAAGFAHSAFYAKQRARPAFAREMRLSLREGYDRVEMAALAAALPESHEDDAWRHNDPPPVPPMTAGQALQLLFLHQKSVRQSWDRPHRRKRRGEPWETYTERLRAMWLSEKAREAEDEALRRAARAEGEARDEAADPDLPILPGTGRGTAEGGGGVPELPQLDQVKGWSKADPNKAPHNPDLALFGGWRLSDWKRSRR